MSPLHHHFTLSEAAQLVGRSPTTLRVLIFRKKLRATKVGSTWFIHRRELYRKYPHVLQREP